MKKMKFFPDDRLFLYLDTTSRKKYNDWKDLQTPV